MRDDIRHELTATGIVMPHGGYQVTSVRYTDPGVYLAVLALSGATIGYISTDGPDDRATFAPCDAGDAGRRTAELRDFAANCRDEDHVTPTLSGLLDALVTEYDERYRPL